MDSNINFTDSLDNDSIDQIIKENQNLAISDFPLEVGNIWYFKRSSTSSASLEDTIEIEIVTEKEINEIKEFEIIFRKNQLNFDTGYFVVDSCSIKYLDETPESQEFLEFKLCFPLKYNVTDSLIDICDSEVSVTGFLEDYRFQGFNFSLMYTLRISELRLNDLKRNIVFFVAKDLGIVYFSTDVKTPPFYHQKSFLLIDYNF